MSNTSKQRFLALIILSLILAAMYARCTLAETLELETFFSREYAGISIRVEATKETIPGGNLTFVLWTNCTALNVNLTSCEVNVYGFRLDKEKTILDSALLAQNASLLFNHTDQHHLTLQVPSDIWGATYADLHIDYVLVDLPLEYGPSFPMTVVRNVFLEELESQLGSLNASYQELNEAYLQLKDAFGQLNQTYWDLERDYTSLREGANELDNTRRLAVLMGITTVFFVGTTIYLVMRKPKEYW